MRALSVILDLLDKAMAKLIADPEGKAKRDQEAIDERVKKDAEEEKKLFEK